ncbi:MAG: UvrD-helicase domain-containing protein [Actinobacteria bacterium]|nr:UvrD-helicase domain-containing protein [Actinomycetota bacterium]
MREPPRRLPGSSPHRRRPRSHLVRGSGGGDGQDDAARCAPRHPHRLRGRLHCRRALAEIEDAAACTLHAFAQRILAEFPLEAGLPPGFEVLDDIESAAEFEAAWQGFVADLLDQGASDDNVIREAFGLGLEVRHLHDLALAFRAQWDRLVDGVIDVPPSVSIDPERVIRPLREAVERLSACTAQESDLMAIHLATLQPLLEQLRGAGGLEALELLRGAPKFTYTNGQAGNWGGKEPLAEVKAGLERAQAAREELLSVTCRRLVGTLAVRVQAFTLECAARRRARGRIEFHDLLVLARNLLADDPTVRRVASARWRWILIDEFQDTDPIQIEIASLLAADASGSDASRAWHEYDVEPGRLFVVGDPKQSIYRFRRADMTLYQAARSRHADGSLRLVANFRCAPVVVDWVNHALGILMGADDTGRQAEYVDLLATREHPGASVRRLGDGCHDPIADIRQREAHDVAQEVRRAREQGWPVRDGAGDSERPIRYADIAVLLPTRRMLPDLECALAAEGVPYRIESRSLLWATQEVRDLISVLASVATPGDEVATVAALRSPALACPDTDLLDWRRRGGSWRIDRPVPDSVPAEHPVAWAFSWLRELSAGHHWEPLHVTVERVLRELHISELQTAHQRPRDRWRRLRFVLDQARAFGERGGATLAAFVDWARSQADEEALVNDAILPEPDDDAVRIMTVHAAKGLEFPAVFLAGLHTYPPSRRPPVLFANDGAVEVAVGRVDQGFATAGYDACLHSEREAEGHEGIRLLYVAAAGARPRAEATPLPVGRPWSGLGREAWRAERGARLERAFRLRAVSATSLGESDGGRDDDAGEGAAPPWQRGRAGTSVGRAVHAVLQAVDLASGQGLDPLARAQAVAAGVPHREADIARAVRAALDSPLVRAAVDGGRYWREVYVGTRVGDTVLEGFVDLLVERDGALHVVDYKTDRVDGAAQLSDRYRLQGAAYALLVQRALARPVERCTFLFVGSGRAVEVAIDDLPAAVDDVLARLE